jgi:hypothetical protein
MAIKRLAEYWGHIEYDTVTRVVSVYINGKASLAVQIFDVPAKEISQPYFANKCYELATIASKDF